MNIGRKLLASSSWFAKFTTYCCAQIFLCTVVVLEDIFVYGEKYVKFFRDVPHFKFTVFCQLPSSYIQHSGNCCCNSTAHVCIHTQCVLLLYHRSSTDCQKAIQYFATTIQECPEDNRHTPTVKDGYKTEVITVFKTHMINKTKKWHTLTHIWLL